jgi:membrane protein
VTRRARGWFIARVVRRFVAVSGYDRALALATQAFVALVPMIFVVAAFLPDANRAAAQSWLVDRFRLSGDASSAVQELVQRPPAQWESTTVLGAVLLVVSVVGFTRSLQRTYLAAWQMPPLGIRGFGYGVLAATVLVAEVTALLLVAPLLAEVPGAVLVTALVRIVPSILVWWPVQRLLVGGHLGWRALLPGAVVAGVGQAVVMAAAGLYVPDQVASQSARFGLIGVAFVLVSWLVALGLLLVLGAVLGAELGARSHVTQEAHGGRFGQAPGPSSGPTVPRRPGEQP